MGTMAFGVFAVNAGTPRIKCKFCQTPQWYRNKKTDTTISWTKVKKS